MPHRQFWAELKQRFLSDNSELLYGEADIFVPNLNQRETEKELAIIECYKLFLLPEIKNSSINQIMLFTKKGGWFVERIELNEFADEKCHQIELIPELLEKPKQFIPKGNRGFAKKVSLPPTKIKLIERPISV